jgi:hypothetical protein
MIIMTVFVTEMSTSSSSKWKPYCNDTVLIPENLNKKSEINSGFSISTRILLYSEAFLHFRTQM